MVLVGIARKPDLPHQVCIEPEDGPLSPDHFSLLQTRASELYDADPESGLIITSPRHHDIRQRQTYLQARGRAIAEVIGASSGVEGLTFHVSQSTSIGGYDVHTCVGIPTGPLNALPAFDVPMAERVYVGKSLQHEVIAECLKRADSALHFPDPGSDLSPLGAAEDIIKAAAQRFIDGTTWRVASMPADLFSVVNEFATLTYERSGAGGHLVITDKKNLESSLTVRFKKPVSLRQARSMRKLLELSDSNASVLADPGHAYGLGHYSSSPAAIEISVTDHAKWELAINGQALVRVAYGRASLPTQVLDFEVFNDVAERTVGSIDAESLWEIINHVQRNGHGTTIVVSSDPKDEAERLGGEAVPIDPVFLPPDEISRLCRVDGAVMLGIDGRCYAFGVILDGMATKPGDLARGSRFNSAVRYQRTSNAGALLVVISDDGTVDLIPKLRPRVRRESVVKAVRAFCAACDGNSERGESFGRTFDKVKRLSFYLSDEQCDRVNESHEIEMVRRWNTDGIAIRGTPFRPDPEMDESYFIEDANGILSH